MSKVIFANRENDQNSIVQRQDQGIINVAQTGDLEGSIKELNNLDSDPDTRMSNIDLRTRLGYAELSGILAFDTLVAFRIIPQRALVFTQQKKRLNVSIDGKGREEIVRLVVGHTDNQKEMSGGFGNRLKTFFTGKK